MIHYYAIPYIQQPLVQFFIIRIIMKYVGVEILDTGFGAPTDGYHTEATNASTDRVTDFEAHLHKTAKLFF